MSEITAERINNEQIEQRKKEIEDLEVECPICAESFKIGDVITFSCQT